MDGWWLVELGAAVAGFVQGLSGFAFGMVSMSFWAWALDPRLAAALAVFGSLTGQLLAVFSVRRGFDWKMLWPFVAGGLAGVPLGVQLLPMLDMTWFKRCWAPSWRSGVRPCCSPRACRASRAAGSMTARPDWWAA